MVLNATSVGCSLATVLQHSIDGLLADNGAATPGHRCCDEASSGDAGVSMEDRRGAAGVAMRHSRADGVSMEPCRAAGVLQWSIIGPWGLPREEEDAGAVLLQEEEDAGAVLLRA
jgi:hypothetical protein